MHLSEIQREIERRFGAGDRESGLAFLALVLAEEVGEVAEAVRRGDREAAAHEAVDAVFIALSFANAAGADVERALCAKFLERDPTATWTDTPGRRGP